jgi:chromosome segregation ATPase
MDPWVSSILALLGIPAFIGSLVTWLTTRRKLNAEAEKVRAEKEKLDSDAQADVVRIVTESATTLLGPLNAQLKQTQTQLDAANKKVRLLSDRVDELVQKVDDANARADASEAENRLLRRQLANINRTRNPRETDR